jgi:putative heme-binding domain-containing protein
LPLASSDLAHWPSAVAAELADKSRGTRGRFVRIELPRRGTLTLAEVQVFSDGETNIAPSGKATQSSTLDGGAAQRAIDGKTSGRYGDGAQTHTRENEENPWWELDLGGEKPMTSVVVWNRTDGGLGKRLDGFRLAILDEKRQVVFEKNNIAAPAESVAFTLESDPAGSLRRAAFEALVSTGTEPQKVFSLLAGLARAGDQRDAALRALGRIAADQWPRGEIKPLIDAIIADASKRSADERTSPAVRDALQIAGELANRLPSDEATALRRTLRTLGVPVVLIRPVPHLITFDRTQLYVEAGKPVEIVFENVDIMPHNFVLARPGQLAKVGVAGEAMAADPNAYSKNFVPSLPEVLQATRLLSPGQVERLLINAPSEPGDYPYVCTFPGHWTRMNGVMHVVPDLDAVPREALLAASAPPAETPGGTRAFVQAWTVNDLAGEMNRLDLGRDKARGKQLFQSLACVQCHKLGGVGTGEVGPDLVSVRKKLDAGQMVPLDVVTEMVEPSKVIDEKYQTLILALASGETVTGVAVARDDKSLRISSNPLAPQGAVVRDIPLADIEEQLVSKISVMPEGLLNTLDKEEILDMLSYILSVGG